MYKKALFFMFSVIVVFAFLNFMHNEYEVWSNNLACDAKCELLGCKTGRLLLGQNNQTIACKCESKHDYLVLLN
ncbi:hypothetical protein [Pseudoalteromonas sp. S16_S37]|uniref:hypothetical protein n=1 Tax=Pseudoalteromonas sp. S16_S37 TaxID=2720228 RepID=UPI0016807547|nr:hypothetical protein [Pseudoalteromonas sp. S16_S37]MBD1583077.1 hypothetical protein [Pseudoalteromonas sp. S16_S37]